MKTFLGSTILVFTAHPDDESYVSGGTLYKNKQTGGTTYLVCATVGERGTSHLVKPLPPAQFKKIRKRELSRASKFLGISEVFLQRVPDGEVSKHTSLLFRKGKEIAKRCRPDFIISFGPDGISGHRDHIAVGKIAKRIAVELKVPFIAFALPPRLTRQANEWLRSKRKSSHYTTKVSFTRPKLRIKINPTIKKRALRLHASQMDSKDAFTGFPRYAVEELLRYEYFVF